MRERAATGGRVDVLRRRFEELHGQLTIRAEGLAALTEAAADEAEAFAAILEAAAPRGYTDRRLVLAGREREIAMIGRRNAERLRTLSEHQMFEHYPHLTPV
jgi:hypothetical protein